MEILALVGGTVVFLVVGRVVAVLGRLCNLRVQPSSGRLAAAEEVPAWLRQPPAAVAEPLRALGFTPVHHERRRPPEADLDRPEEGGRWVAVWVNRTDRVFAELHPSPSPNTEQPLRVTFESLFDERRLSTVDARDLLLRSSVGSARIVKPDGPGYLRQWAAHCSAWQALEDEHGASLEARLPSPAAYSARHNTEAVHVFELMRGEGDLEEREGGLFFHWRRLLGAVGGGEGRVATPSGTLRARPDPGDGQEEGRCDGDGVDDARRADEESLVALEAWAYRQREALETHAVPGLRFKGAVFAASALYCTWLLSFILPWDFLAFLLPVLLLHELGHLAAMHAFGYTDKRLFFLPLGAAVSGRKTDVSPLQESIVYLAGPVPGLLLALALLWLVPEPAESLLHLVVVLLVVNGLNLLPLLPLDGGQIVHRLIGFRYPTTRFLLYGFSVVVAVAFAVALQDPILGILAVWLMLGAREQWRSRGLARRLVADIGGERGRGGASGEGGERALLERVFGLLGPRFKDYEHKRLAAREQLLALTRPSLAARHAAGIALLFLASLLGPPLVAMALLDRERDAVVHASVPNEEAQAPRVATLDGVERE